MSEEAKLIEDKIGLAVLYFKSSDFHKSLKLYNDLTKDLTRYTPSQIRDLRTNVYKLNANVPIGPLVHPKLPTILDQRAATYEKLGEVGQATKDAERLIKFDPLGCKGYLRLGKLYSKKGQITEAYKTYQKGIYIIEKSKLKFDLQVPEKLLRNLKEHYSSLNKQLKAQKSQRNQNKTESELLPSSDSRGSKGFSSIKENSFPVINVSRTPSFTTNTGLQKRLDEMIPLPLKRASSVLTSSISTHSSSFSTQVSSATSQQQMLDSENLQGFKRPKITTDPMYWLPIEIISLIFSHVSLRSILLCHLVSRDWYTSLTHIPSLYNNRVIFKSKITASEFFDGFKLLKRIVARSHSREIKVLKLRSTLNWNHLHRILDALLSEKNIKLESVDIINKDFNMELFLNKLNKFNWNTDKFSNMKTLRIGINSSLRFENSILNMMKKLHTLEIVILDKTSSGASKSLIPSNIPDHLNSDSEIWEELNTLTVVNHPHLNNSFMGINVNDGTYNPYPPFLNEGFPNLTSLTIVSFEFTDRENELGKFFTKTPHLTSIYLENNQGVSLKGFFTLLSNYQPTFMLKKLTMREKAISKAFNMNEFDATDLPQLSYLEYLDLYSSSLSIFGLIKLLKIANTTQNLKALMIGNSNYIYFKNDRISTRPKLDLATILLSVPSLEMLSLNELELDNSSMRFFHKDLHEAVGLDKCKLKVLDLSFCTSLTGAGLMNLFTKVYGPYEDTAQVFRLEKLVLDGVELHEETLKSLRKSKYVEQIKNDHFRPRWKQYGVNTLVPDIAR